MRSEKESQRDALEHDSSRSVQILAPMINRRHHRFIKNIFRIYKLYQHDSEFVEIRNIFYMKGRVEDLVNICLYRLHPVCQNGKPIGR